MPGSAALGLAALGTNLRHRAAVGRVQPDRAGHEGKRGFHPPYLSAYVASPCIAPLGLAALGANL